MDCPETQNTKTHLAVENTFLKRLESRRFRNMSPCEFLLSERSFDPAGEGVRVSPDCSWPSGCAGQVCLVMSTVQLCDISGFAMSAPHLPLITVVEVLLHLSTVNVSDVSLARHAVGTSQLAVLLDLFCNMAPHGICRHVLAFFGCFLTLPSPCGLAIGKPCAFGTPPRTKAGICHIAGATFMQRCCPSCGKSMCAIRVGPGRLERA